MAQFSYRINREICLPKHMLEPDSGDKRKEGPNILNNLLDAPRGTCFFKDTINDEFRITFNNDLIPTPLNSSNKTISKSNAFNHIYGILSNMALATLDDKAYGSLRVHERPIKVNFNPTSGRGMPFNHHGNIFFLLDRRIKLPITQAHSGSSMDTTSWVRLRTMEQHVIPSLPDLPIDKEGF
ncbi:Hypothetical predicted protein [Prunus dulcis]|uniref:Uncharacterized protein n=1 Tax=Prunus dulcis TaxID=3755 RepID=A0A5E4G796_PRUDU|nr:Hypothetical predicted protein [Prunus dulcis]